MQYILKRLRLTSYAFDDAIRFYAKIGVLIAIWPAVQLLDAWDDYINTPRF